jgi:hypothetical protein
MKMKKACEKIRTEFFNGSSPEFEKHLEQCAECRDWFADMQKTEKVWDIGSNLLPKKEEMIAARQEAIRRIKLGDSKKKLLSVFKRPISWKLAWGIAASVIVFATGIYVGILMRSIQPEAIKTTSAALPTWITKAIQSPSSDLPPEIQTAGWGLPKILAYMIKNDRNEGHRLESVTELSKLGDEQLVRDALIYALKNDSNPGVRIKAIKALSDYQVNPALRDAYIYALWHDDNPGVRLEAIEALKPIAQEKTVNEVLQFVASRDNHEGVRVQAREAIRSTNAG